MNQEYHQQAQRLQELRKEQLHRQQAAAYGYSTSSSVNAHQQIPGVVKNEVPAAASEPLKDPLIFPGIYAPSGFNIMDILVSVHTRPNPQINIGKIDQSVALTLCDIDLPDMPIVYCSEGFEVLTNYTPPEILGRNCRFLQQPPAVNGQHLSTAAVTYASTDVKRNEEARREMRTKLQNGDEARVTFVNFTKEGRKFVNVVTTIPVLWEGGKRYMVGFQADAKGAFR